MQIASLVLDLASKAKRAVRDLLEPPEVLVKRAHGQPVFFLFIYLFQTLKQNEVESMRLKTRDYELIVGQSGNYTLAVIQQQVPAIAAQSVGSASSKKSEAQQQQTQVTVK